MHNLCYSYRRCILWLLELLVLCCLTMNYFFQRCFPSKEPGNFRELLKERSSNAANRRGEKESRCSPAFDGCVIEKQPLPNGEPTNTNSSHVFTVENTQRSRSLESSSPVEKFRKQLSLSLTSLVEWNQPKDFNSSPVEKDTDSTRAKPECVAEPHSAPKGTLASLSCESVVSLESSVAEDSAKEEKDDTLISSEALVKDDPSKSSQVSDNDDDLSMSLHTIFEDESSEVIQTTCENSNVDKDDSSLSFQTRYEDESLKTTMSPHLSVENDLAMSPHTSAKQDCLPSSHTLGEQESVMSLQPPSENCNMLSSQSPITASQTPLNNNNNFALQSPNDASDISSQMHIEENDESRPTSKTDVGLDLTTSPINDNPSIAYPTSVEENKGGSSQLHVENELLVNEQSSVLRTDEIPVIPTNEELGLAPHLQLEKDHSPGSDDQQILQSDCKHTNETIPHSSDYYEDLLCTRSNSKAKVSSQRAASDLPKDIRIAIDDADDEDLEITHL